MSIHECPVCHEPALVRPSPGVFDANGGRLVIHRLPYEQDRYQLLYLHGWEVDPLLWEGDNA